MNRDEESKMHAEHATSDAPTLELPKDLLAELQRRGSSRRHDLSVEGWKPSVLERLIGALTGRR
jgi:hypothetical protein